MPAWRAEEADRRARQDIESWIPRRLFDAHAHLYRRDDLGPNVPRLLAEGPSVVGGACYRDCMSQLVGAAGLDGALFMPYPAAGADLPLSNGFAISQARAFPGGRASLVVAPAMDPGSVDELAADPVVAGLKPYHCYSPESPTLEASLESYAPSWVWELAARRGLVITLHLVRARALADGANQEALLRLCARHPGVRVVLAHAGRGFHAPDTRKGLSALRGLGNLWLDTSAICEPEPLVAALEILGTGRVLWGSDFPVSHLRGRCVTVGDGFAWLDEEVAWSKVSPACSPIFAGLESLRALRAAAELLGLDREDLDRVFRRNAAELFGPEEGRPERTAQLYRHAKERIPGGTQLLSKRPEMLAPELFPAYAREARGCEVEDLDGRRFIDMTTNAVGSCLLGFNHPRVSAAVRRRVALGSMSSLNPAEEVELADRLCAIHPWADQVRLTRTGGETAAVAVRIARATTDRSVVAVCGYHGWQDWYLAANLGTDDALRGHLLPGLAPLGVPRELRGTTLTFPYEDRQAFDRVVEEAGDRLAAVVMEPCRHHDPVPGFLEHVRDRAHEAGALLLFDEITIGWRLIRGGAHLRLGVAPDIAFFAKALGNGHPMGAVIGTREAMRGAHESFISSTYWTEGVGPAAALAALEVFAEIDVPAHVARIGGLLKECWRRRARAAGVPIVVEQGYDCLPRFRFDHPEAEALRTLFTQLMLKQGYLAGPACYPTLAHTPEIVGRYEAATATVLGRIAELIASGGIAAALEGPVAHSGFRRLV